jgi:hypothetical protein
VHELTHNLLCHLPIPLWLNEGLAVLIEQTVTQKPFVMVRGHLMANDGTG